MGKKANTNTKPVEKGNHAPDHKGCKPAWPRCLSADEKKRVGAVGAVGEAGAVGKR